MEKYNEIVKLIQKEDVKKSVKEINESNADLLDIQDSNGWSLMHHAATRAHPEIIQALVEKNVKIVCFDNRGQIPLHKAAKFGKINSILALLAHGSVVYTVDWHFLSPIELAVKGRHVEVVELLLRCGSSPLLLDWEWAKNHNTLQSDHKTIAAKLSEYRRYIQSFNNGSIRIEVKRINSSGETDLNAVGVIVDMKSEKADFYILVRRLQTEYTDVLNSRRNDVHLISDVIELQTWNYPRNDISLKVSAHGRPSRSEEVVFIAENGVAGTVHDSTLDKNNQSATVTVDVIVLKNKAIQFALGVIPKKQIVSITNNAKTIFPEMEPGSSIEIPGEAFSSPTEMSINVIDNGCDEIVDKKDDGQQSLLLSNTMCITTSNTCQPSKDLIISLPVYHEVKEEEYMVVSTSKDEPDSIDDWEIFPAGKDQSGKSATFQILHFSLYAISTKTQVNKDLDSVTQEILHGRDKKRKIKFVVLAKPSEKAWSVIVACPVSRKVNNCVMEWEKKGYDQIGISVKEVFACTGQPFIFQFHSADDTTRQDECDLNKLCFESDRNNFLSLTVIAKSPNMEKYLGTISILEVKEIKVSQNVEESGCCCCLEGKTKTVFSSEQISDPLTDIDIMLPVLIPEIIHGETDPVDEPGDYAQYQSSMKKIFEAEDYRDESTISALTFRSIRALVQNFTTEDAKSLGIQLRISPDRVESLIKGRPGYVAAKNILDRFRGKRPHRSQVYTLIDALKACGMHGQANRLEHAYEIGGDCDQD